MQTETFLPCFPGFYETIFEFNNEDQDLDYINEKRAEIGLNPVGYDDVKWNYKSYRLEVSKKAVAYIEKMLNDLLPCKLTFNKLQQPREYNFSTDMIIIDAEFDPEQLRKLLFDCPDDAIKGLLENFMPRDGFAPFSETLKKADVNYWMGTDFAHFQDFGWAAQTILESHPDSEFDMDSFAVVSTHEVEAGIDNYNVLVPDCTYKMEREPGGDYVYAFMDVEIRHCFNPVSGTFFGVRVSGFIENVNAFYYRYKERIEAMVHPEDFFREIKAVRV